MEWSTVACMEAWIVEKLTTFWERRQSPQSAAANAAAAAAALEYYYAQGRIPRPEGA